MVAIVATDEVYSIIEDLNIRGTFTMQRITAQGVSGIRSALEQCESLTHVIVDVEAIRGNVEHAYDLMCKVRLAMPHVKLIGIAMGFDGQNTLIRDIEALGQAETIVSDTPAGLKMQLNRILVADDIAAPAPLHPPAFGGEPEAVFPQGQLLPSQLPRAAGKARMLPVRPANYAPKAITVAVAGVGPRIGTTTQTAQIAHYIKQQNTDVAIIQVDDKNSLADYVDILEATKLIDAEHYTVNSIDLFRSRNSIARAKADFPYLICDYGDYLQLPDVSAFLDKDIKIIVCGVKPWESDGLRDVFPVDDGSIHYVFSHVPEYDQEAVLELMKDSAPKTHFAAYAPDYWCYCGDDETYAEILGFVAMETEKQPRPKKPWLPFIKR